MRKIYRHKRIKKGVMQYHDAYIELSEMELKRIPNKYWIDDLPNNAAKQLGKLGGQKTSSKYGKDHFKKIGTKGAAKRWKKLEQPFYLYCV